MAKRDRLEIIRDILEIIRNHKNSIKITPLMRASGISSSGFKEYFFDLKSKGFLKDFVGPDNKRYITLTDKGFRYLEKYKSIRTLIDDFGL